MDATASAAKGRAGATLVRADDRPAAVVEFEQALVQFFVQAADLIGAPKSVAAIYAICFASPEPLGFVEIQKRLNVSVGSLSQGLRVLRAVGALRCVQPTALSEGRLGTKLGSERRDFYEPNLEARKLIAAWLDQKLQTQINAGSSQLSAVLDSIPREYSGGSETVRGRLEHLQNWHDKAHALVPLVKAFLRVP